MQINFLLCTLAHDMHAAHTTVGVAFHDINFIAHAQKKESGYLSSVLLLIISNKILELYNSF